MTPNSSKSPSDTIGAVTPGNDENKDKRVRILDAAQRLFVKYGVKRTSIEDIVRETGIAKGTLYLYYESKDALFASVAERLCAEILDKVQTAVVSSPLLTEQLVGALDANIGFMHRLLAESPHMAELTDSKEALAAATFAAFDLTFKERLRTVLSNGGITRHAAVEMLVAAAIGTLRTGDTDESSYQMRLSALIEILIVGLRASETR